MLLLTGLALRQCRVAEHRGRWLEQERKVINGEREQSATIAGWVTIAMMPKI